MAIRLNLRFNGEEKDVLQSIGALKSAIAVLGKHHAELVQVSSAADSPPLVQTESIEDRRAYRGKFQFLVEVPADQLIHITVLIEGQFRKHKDLVRTR